MNNRKLILIGVGVLAVYFLFIKGDDDESDKEKSGSS